MNSVTQKSTVEQTDAWRLGRVDARDGNMCLPELYFSRPRQWVAYVRGYETWLGVQTLLSRQAMRLAAQRIAGGAK